MSKPQDTLWDYEEHTRAKHQLLVGYLNAWYPIMANTGERAVNVIDGFAGPGRYKDGSPGSPLLMIDAFISHTNRSAAMGNMDVYFDFIEERRDRAEYLQDELSRLVVPPNVHVAPVHVGSFDQVIAEMLDNIPPAHALAPTFAFIDPFGYTGHGMHLSSRILQFKKCEVLIYVPLPFIARFINDPVLEPAFNNLFGDSSWKDAQATKGRAAERVLHERFLQRVEKAAGHAISFEVDAAAGRGWAGYSLYFGTRNPVGLERMKEAMWRVDPAQGSGFAYSVNPDQLQLFSGAPDLRPLEAALREHFGTNPFTIEQAALFTTLKSSFAPRIHLKTRTLMVAEKDGRLEARHPDRPKRRCGQYPDGTVLRFVQ